jgi:hemolysin activation/secretion protein
MMTSIPEVLQHDADRHRDGKPRLVRSAHTRRHRVDVATLLLCYALIPGAAAQIAQVSSVRDPEVLRQQERERALREQQERTPDVRLRMDEPDGTGKRLPAAEEPCFLIDDIVFDGATSDFAWALDYADRVDDGDGDIDRARGRCLGSTAINLVMKRVQNAIIARGFITTRVLAPPQDLRGGVLRLTIVPGRIRAVRFSADSDARANAGNALAFKPGDLLNLRDIEQTLENFKRLPTVDASIEIVAGEAPGESDLLITWKQAFPLRLTLAADNSGSPATGQYLGNVTISADNPLGVNDLFYANFNHDLDGDGTGHGTQGYTVHYSLPFGDWLLAATGNANRYHQSVAGLNQTYIYGGTNSSQEIKLSRLIQRDATSRTWASLRAYLNTSNYRIDDTEIEVQRRRMAGWEAAFEHRAFVAGSTLDLVLSYRRGTGAFGALPAPEEAFGEGASHPIVVSADAQLLIPFSLANLPLRYAGRWRAQWNGTPLIVQDRFSIGGRYTVRGFDGNQVLMADRGWFWRNDVGLPLGDNLPEVYAGIDFGEVGGQSAELLVGRRLCGAVFGLRGNYRRLAYDVFAGVPIDKPAGFETARVAAGFSLALSF